MSWAIPDYDEIYRTMHPRRFPFNPFERQRELRDLWPDEQRQFRKMVDVLHRVKVQTAPPTVTR